MEEFLHRFFQILRGVPGLFLIIVVGYLLSTNRKSIKWKTIAIGLSLQLIVALLVLKFPPVQYFISLISRAFLKILDFTKEGSTFIFGDLLNVESYGFIFAFQILPTIVFFSALTSILFYYGIIQKVVYLLAWVMVRLMKLSGAESLAAAGNIFLGQTESPLLIKAYLSKMTKSELFLVMVGGMATIAGGVMAIYIGFLGGNNDADRMIFAKHLITASVMAAPGAVIIAKLLVPQTEEIENKELKISKNDIGSNVLDAISNGTIEGVKLAVNVAAMLIVFIGLVALMNFILMKIGDWTSLNDFIANSSNNQYETFSLQFVLGGLMAPFMWCIGIEAADIMYVGQLLGEKTILNELIAYKSLKEYIIGGQMSQKSIIMATYILCGFANIGSVGMQIGGIGAIAPNQRKQLSKFGIKALIGGALTSLLSATIVGMLIG